MHMPPNAHAPSCSSSSGMSSVSWDANSPSPDTSNNVLSEFMFGVEHEGANQQTGGYYPVPYGEQQQQSQNTPSNYAEVEEARCMNTVATDLYYHDSPSSESGEDDFTDTKPFTVPYQPIQQHLAFPQMQQGQQHSYYASSFQHQQPQANVGHVANGNNGLRFSGQHQQYQQLPFVDMGGVDFTAGSEAVVGLTPSLSTQVDGGRTVHLWEFIIKLLEDQRYSSCVRWVDRNEGEFQ